MCKSLMLECEVGRFFFSPPPPHIFINGSSEAQVGLDVFTPRASETISAGLIWSYRDGAEAELVLTGYSLV